MPLFLKQQFERNQMLVLSRKKGNQVKIAGDIVVTVLQVKGNTVRLGIEAPKSVGVFRGEVYEQAMKLGPKKPDLEPMKVTEG